MNLLELSYYLQNEEASKNYLLEKGILKNFTECPYCGSDKIGSIRRDRKRCYKCKKEWHQRKGSFLESKHISYSKFLGILKLYIAEYSILAISMELRIERKTVIQIVNELRRIIIPVDVSSWGNTAYLELKDNEINIRPARVNTVHPKTTDRIILEIERFKEVGNIYSFLIKSQRVKGKKYEYTLLDRFLGFTRMKLVSYVGINQSNLYAFLFELVVKFKLGEQNYFSFLLQKLRVAETTQSL